MANILVVDDDRVVQTVARQVLEAEGHTVDVLEDGHATVDIVEHSPPDLLILDIVMPEISGLTICRQLRANPYTARLPIIFLTARSRPREIAQGLEAGGDDYVTKETMSIELPARVKAVLRRVGTGPLNPESDWVHVHGLRLHTSRPEVIHHEETIHLTTVEYQLLHTLMLHAGHPLSAERLLQDVWDYPPGTGDPHLVRTHIGNLRHKLGDNVIHTVRGQGYLIESL